MCPNSNKFINSTMTCTNNVDKAQPPIILQSNEADFQSAIRDEFIEGSAIAPSLFEAIAEFASDLEIENSEVAGEPIADFRNWEVKTSQAGFSSRLTEFALFLRNEDGTAWQDKSNLCRWSSEKQRHGKGYTAPRATAGQLPSAYLPPIDNSTREKLGISLEGSFWDAVQANPSIPIVLTEGGKKSLSGLSGGHVSIALYGVDAGSKKVDGQHVLVPDLARFCQQGRTFIIAFDKDSNPETIERVERSTRRLSWLLGKQSKGIAVKVA